MGLGPWFGALRLHYFCADHCWISIGHLRLNVHGMAAVWFGQAIWFVVAGYQLWSARAAAGQRALG
jgi:hypothetical protein